MSITDVWVNNTLRDEMVCDIVDNCTKTKTCNCRCTSIPSRKQLIVDCSNQSCTQFPEVVPETRHEYDLVLNMSWTKISKIEHMEYFNKVKIVDLSFSKISKIQDDIDKMVKLKMFFVPDHKLQVLPRRISNLDPNVFYFGNNGIPCNCDNVWIGQWRKYRNATSKLYCSNYSNRTFEEMFAVFRNCDDTKDPPHTLMSSLAVTVMILTALPFILWYFRFELAVVRRRIRGACPNSVNMWEYDVFVSLDENNTDVRKFVANEIIPLFEITNNYKMFIPMRNGLYGNNFEESILTSMTKCKNILIIQSQEMYGSSKHASMTTCSYDSISQTARKTEFNIAWKFFVSGKVNSILVINFDNSNNSRFSKKRNTALFRNGMGLEIFNRKIDIKRAMLKFMKQ